jgi:hypothetical protein
MPAPLETTGRSAVPPNKCTLGRLIDRLDGNDRVWLTGRLINPDDYSSVWISQHLRADGHDIAPHVVARHRRRSQGNGCRCPLL